MRESSESSVCRVSLPSSKPSSNPLSSRCFFFFLGLFFSVFTLAWLLFEAFSCIFIPVQTSMR